MRAPLRLAAVVLPALLLAGCEDPAPSESSVAAASLSLPGGRDSCQLLTQSDVQPALAPASASPAPSPAGPPKTSHSVRTAATTVKGALKTNFALDRCTYEEVDGQSIIVTVYAPQKANGFTGKLSELTDLTQGATTLSIGGAAAALSQSQTGAILAFQDGDVTVSVAYPGGEPAGGPSRAQRLATLAATILHAPVPSLPAVSAPVAQASPSASPTAAPAAGEPTTGATAAKVVQETDSLQFTPADVTVKVGDVVEWDNAGSSAHNVTFSGQKSITSPTMAGGAKYQVKFTTAGSYSYVCTFHVAQNMTGTVTVTS